MTTYTGTQTVESGLYLNTKNFAVTMMEKPGTLAGTELDTFRRVPMVVMLAVAPLLGLAYVMFLPFVGFVAMAHLVGTKTLQLAGEAATDGVRVLRPSWAPALAFLTRSKPATPKAVEPRADEWKDAVEKKLDDTKVQ